MLTNAAIKALKPKDKFYKIADRDSMYVVIQPSGSVVFRYDYRMNGRRETLTLGRYGSAGLSLARAREKLIDAQRTILEGRSPAQEKQREKRRIKEAKSFGEFAERWLQEHRMAESTRAMRRTIYERDIHPTFRNRLLTEISPEDRAARPGRPILHDGTLGLEHREAWGGLRAKRMRRASVPLRLYRGAGVAEGFETAGGYGDGLRFVLRSQGLCPHGRNTERDASTHHGVCESSQAPFQKSDRYCRSLLRRRS